MPANRWVLGARPRTLPAAVVPVVVGTAAAATTVDVVWWRFVAALVASLAIQVGTNYANDVADGVRGTDDRRVGPVRLVAGGLATPKQVRLAALASAGAAAVAGLALAVAVGPEVLVIGVASFVAGYFYTGGPKPYGYLGLGEVFVFVFFGLVATVGSAYVQADRVLWVAVAAAVPVGLVATALLVVNNLRDIPTDREAGKRTLAVRLGDRRTRAFYVGLVVVAVASAAAIGLAHPWALLSLGAAVAVVRPVRTVTGGASGPHLVPVLGDTGRLQLVLGALLTAGLLAS